jgi:hypothetical protein
MELANTFLKFKELDYDVRSTNKWVQQRNSELKQQGKITTDMTAHLFTAYKTSNDKSFVQYIEQLEDLVSDSGVDYPYTKLMQKALNKADRLATQRKLSNITGPKDDDILALEAKIEELTKQQDQSSKEQPTEQREQKQRRKPKPLMIPDEVLTKPIPDDLNKPIEFDGKKYWYCPVHEWTRHPFHNQGEIQGCFTNKMNKRSRNNQQTQSTSDSNNNNSSNTRSRSGNSNKDDGRYNGRLVRALTALADGG